MPGFQNLRAAETFCRTSLLHRRQGELCHAAVLPQLLAAALKGCVEWARENNRGLITAAEMKSINGKRAGKNRKK